MMPDEIEQLVQEQIAGRWSESNDHGIDLHFSLVTPTQIKVIEWRVKDGRSMESLLAVWLVLEERPVEKDGYQIVYSEQMKTFGLASSGATDAQLPVLCGWYGDFLTTFKSM